MALTRVFNAFAAVVALVCIVVVVDNATYRLTTGNSIKGFDYLVLGLAAGYLVMLVVARDTARKLAVGLTVGLLALFACEAALSVAAGASGRGSPWYVWPPDYTCRLEPQGLVGIAPEGAFRTNSRGIRGPEFSDDDDYRVLCVGGSTTECLYLDDAKSWPALLERRLRGAGAGNVWVGNAGRSGLLAADHVTLCAELPEAREVDAWLVMCGINDFGRQLRGDYAESRDATFRRTFVHRQPGIFSRPRRPLQRNLFTFSALEGLRDRAKVALAGGDAAVFQDRRAARVDRLRAGRKSGTVTTERPDLEPWLAEYESQLAALIRLARDFDRRLIMVTQPTLWSADMPPEIDAMTLGGETADGRFLDNAVRAKCMAAYNRVMLDVCAREGVTCIDLASALPKTTEVFYDDCHFNESGAERVAGILAASLLDER